MMMMMVRGAVNFDMVGRLKGIFYKGVYRTTEESLTQITTQCSSLTSLSVAGQRTPVSPSPPLDPARPPPLPRAPATCGRAFARVLVSATASSLH